ncbi:Homeobox-leucine zipper protein ATHB-15, putative isoform 2 [Hibiscus syriacus]|uniref:Homeobox-leucine zipper protein ATHB-15, putative isoform 2 n=1 Tax=Hibiscus syriacus TaxID=106335 RepID=A0A6A2XFG1_HIBSY|nr:Homeobox-leucine zipper protein ATHB-15, putative isoform 2 [Hibiscus syriacus]
MRSWTAAESDMVAKNRLVGFLLWQSILSSLIYLAFAITIVYWRSFTAIFISFFSFHLSQLLFSVSLSTVLSPQPKLRRILPVLLAAAAVSGSLSAVSLCGSMEKWGLRMGIHSAIARTLNLSAAAYLFSALLLVFLPHGFGTDLELGNFFSQHIISYAAGFSMFLCWELTHHLHQVLHTKRFIFAPPKGSAAAETNPSEPLLAALEETSPASFLKYLAYLDLCMVCENNVDYWRRAAFFEETGETYKRVAAVCLRPLDQLASKLVQGFEGMAPYSRVVHASIPRVLHVYLLKCSCCGFSCFCHRLLYITLLHIENIEGSGALLFEANRAHLRFGVAQLSGSNAAVISTLIASLLAVETLMGKNISLQPSHNLMGAFGTKSATFSAGRRDARDGKRRDDPLYAKAYAMADVLRTSIYCIVSAFHHEMLASAKAGLLQKDWITSGKPPFGTRELLSQKLHLFLDFQAS